MVEQIRGNIVEKSPTFCVIDMSGMGIGVNISLNTFQSLKSHGKNSQVSLYTHLHVREDLLQLYGFYEMAEKELFRLLISVSGIGPRLALTLLSGPSSEEIQSAIANEDILFLTKVPGVGRKTAQRLIVELKEKISEAQKINEAEKAISAPIHFHPLFQEAMLALIQLGYKQQDAGQLLSKAMKQIPDTSSIEDLIKQALKER
jgi:Holliday junction DNA helicase RuvA